MRPLSILKKRKYVQGHSMAARKKRVRRRKQIYRAMKTRAGNFFVFRKETYLARFRVQFIRNNNIGPFIEFTAQLQLLIKLSIAEKLLKI